MLDPKLLKITKIRNLFVHFTYDGYHYSLREEWDSDDYITYVKIICNEENNPYKNKREKYGCICDFLEFYSKKYQYYNQDWDVIFHRDKAHQASYSNINKEHFLNTLVKKELFKD